MNFHVMTLFPEMIDNGMGTSITGRAMRSGQITVNSVNMRDYADESRKRRVDDYPYGGGAGMVIQAQPVYACYKAVCEGIEARRSAEADTAAAGTGDSVSDEEKDVLTAYDVPGTMPKKRIRTVYMTPQGTVFQQNMARELALEEDLIILCGHYEGIDERVLDEICTDFISIGDYVLTGGELAAMVVMDAVSRNVPGVLSNAASGEEESFSEGLLEYPQYTRPEIWHDRKVPDILMSGHHANVDIWRRQMSLLRTRQRRPDLFEKAELTKKDIRFLQEYDANHHEDEI